MASQNVIVALTVHEILNKHIADKLA